MDLADVRDVADQAAALAAIYTDLRLLLRSVA